MSAFICITYFASSCDWAKISTRFHVKISTNERKWLRSVIFGARGHERKRAKIPWSTWAQIYTYDYERKFCLALFCAFARYYTYRVSWLLLSLPLIAPSPDRAPGCTVPLSCYRHPCNPEYCSGRGRSWSGLSSPHNLSSVGRLSPSHPPSAIVS